MARMERLPVPALVPPIARTMVPWARNHVRRVVRRYCYVSVDDVWDEAVTALIRAAHYYEPSAGPFPPYARTAIHRACARLVQVGQRRRKGYLLTVSLSVRDDEEHHAFRERVAPHEAFSFLDDWHAPSVEDELIACETVAAHEPGALQRAVARSNGTRSRAARAPESSAAAGRATRAAS